MKVMNIFKGVAALLAVLLALSVSGTVVLYENEGVISNYLGIATGQIVNLAGTEGDLTYYKSAYGDGSFSAENLSLLVGDTYEQNVKELEEGAVLLKNDGALPFSVGERKVDLYGQYIDAPVDMGSGEYAIDLKTALENESFDIAADDADVAIIMLSRSVSEGNELSMINSDGISSLALQQSEKQIIQSVKTSGKYRKIIALINSSNPLEMEWAYSAEYGVDAVLWIGGPGQRGFAGVVNILTGKANPSGRLTDTYATVSTSAPACVNGSTNISRWSNVDYLRENSDEVASSIAYYNVQTENIYVGYKYYETRYEDCILGRYSASSEVGSSTGGAWNYADEITYPFGYGLSYTTFSQTFNNMEDNGDVFTVSVTVKNTGDVVGKSVVQVYAQTPYGEYERQNLVEKSAVQLVAFDKTDMIEPGGEETLEIEVDKYFLASYDYINARGYILSEGTYYLAIGDDCHDALNNILAAKGCEGMTDAAGVPVGGDAAKTYSWELAALDTQTYRYAEGGEVTNRFEDCDINYWLEDSVTYLSRSDWEGTYPVEKVSLAITDEMIEVLNGETYQKPADAPDYSSFTQGANNGITALDMMGVEYGDDEKWNKFIDQLTVPEMASLLAGDFSKDQIDSIVLPSYFSGDGIDNLRASYRNDPLDRSCCRYSNEIVLASTWNRELVISRGRLMGEEMLFCGYFQIYGPGANLHRTPFCGRNKEYCSEDTNFTYLVTAELVKGFREKGVGVQIKHLAGNDQEYNRSGLCIFFTEQAWREGSLRGFEGAIREGGADGCMNGLNRVGLRWTNSSYALCTGVLREEWGFEGVVGSDGIASKYQTHFTTSLAAGTNSYCLDGKGSSSAAIVEYLEATNDGYMLSALRQAAKRNLYRLVNSPVMNGLTADSVILYQTAWWQTATTVIIAALAAADLCMLALYIAGEVRAKREEAI